MYLPIIVLVVYSFNNASFTMQWQGFTWHWYQQLLQNSRLLQMALHSFLLAISAATLATVFGILAATSMYRYRFYGRKSLYLLIFLLVVSPEIVMAISLLSFFTYLKVPLGFMSLLLAHTTFCIPFTTMTIYSRLIEMDSNLIKVAKDLGASEWRILHQVLFPLIKLSVLAGWLLSLTLSLDDFIISFFLSGPEFPVLPLEIYSWVRLGIKPELNALCSVSLGLTLTLVLISQFLLKEKK